MSHLPDVVAAIRRLEGVEAASLSWPEPEGPATLRIELVGGGHREAALAEVLGALRDVGEVDLSTVVPENGGTTGAPTRAGNRGATEGDGPKGGVAGEVTAIHDAWRRCAFVALDVDRGDLDAAMSVSLRYDGREATGRATGLATRRAAPRLAAAATLSALQELLGDGLRLQLDWIEVREGPPERPGTVEVGVACLTREGEEVLVGGAMARGDLREAAVRATLDACNRRAAQLVATGT